MAISVKPTHLKRYKDLASLFVKYGRSDLVRHLDLPQDPGVDAVAASGEGAALGQELARDLEKLGPSFIKLGQLLSTRSDLLPVPYVEALARLQDDVAPFSFADVERIVSEELGVRLSKGFVEFESVPLAAASLGQVHRAALRGGRAVAVKVQRPGIRDQILEDLEVFEEVARMLDKHTGAGARFHFEKMVGEFRKTLLSELDYRQEAQHLVILGENLEGFDRILIPRPVEDYTTSRVLTMRRLFPRRPAFGKRLRHAGPQGGAHRPRHGRADLPRVAGAAAQAAPGGQRGQRRRGGGPRPGDRRAQSELRRARVPVSRVRAGRAL